MLTDAEKLTKEHIDNFKKKPKELANRREIPIKKRVLQPYP